MASPRRSAIQAFKGLAEPMNTAPPSPMATIQKNSTEPKPSANSAMAGDATIITAVPNSPPNTEKYKPIPRASSGLPLRVSW